MVEVANQKITTRCWFKLSDYAWQWFHLTAHFEQKFFPLSSVLMKVERRGGSWRLLVAGIHSAILWTAKPISCGKSCIVYLMLCSSENSWTLYLLCWN